MYLINFSKLVNNLLPAILRKKRMRAWIECLVYPLQDLHNSFVKLREELILEATATPQVASLEFIINKILFNGRNDCFISDNDHAARILIYNRNEEKRPTVLIYNRSEGIAPVPPICIFNRNEPREHDFNIHVPGPLSSDKRDQIIKLANKYRAAGFFFKILEYEPTKTE